MTAADKRSVGLARVLEPRGVLPQAAWRLDARPEIGADEVRIAVERLNLDAASFRQLSGKHDGDGAAVRREVLEIIGTRGKMHNPVTGSGGMLIGVVDAVGPESPLPVKPGARVATLVSLTLTPLAVTDGLARWDGLSEQVPAAGHAILFGRSVAAVLPDDLTPELALAVFDVCGAPALTDRVVRGHGPGEVSVAVLVRAGPWRWPPRRAPVPVPSGWSCPKPSAPR
jgi:L-erythro-3,5-diaminohexanoate dehydrogenase